MYSSLTKLWVLSREEGIKPIMPATLMRKFASLQKNLVFPLRIAEAYRVAEAKGRDGFSLLYFLEHLRILFTLFREKVKVA